MTCTRCHAAMNVVPPAIEVANELTVSMIIVNHGVSKESLKCVACGCQHMMGIQSADFSAINIIAMAVPEEQQESRIIQPGSGLIV